jgi:hypothetical protein
MRSTIRVARTVGILLLLHLAVGLITPFILLHAPMGPRGFLLDAAENAVQLRMAVFLLTVGSAFAIAVAVAALPFFRRYSSAMAFWLLALAVAGFTLQAVDNGRLLSMLSLSQEYASAGASKSEVFQSLALVVGQARQWAHFTCLLVAVSWIFLLFSLLFRFRLVPRALAVFGMIASLLQIIGVPLRAMLGYSPETRLAMPLAPAYVALALWLLVRGFNERERPVEVEANGAELAQML